MENAILELHDLAAGYNGRLALRGVSLTIEQTKVASVIGHNGAGKSTLLKTIAGILPIIRGQIFFDGKDITKTSPRDRVKNGLAYVPQGNRLFQRLTVQEQLLVVARGRWTLRKAKDEIGHVMNSVAGLKGLASRRGFELSGGERQLVAYSMGIVLRPKVMLLDEPTLGLSPNMVTDVLEKIRTAAREERVAILVVEQRVQHILRVCDWCYVIKQGEVSFSGPPDALNNETLGKVFI